MKNKYFLHFSLYWVCQLLGWGGAALYWSWHQVIGDHSIWIGIASVVVSFLVGIGSTHLYKIIAHQKGWNSLSLIKLIPRMGLALFVLTGVYLIGGFLGLSLKEYTLELGGFLGMLMGGLRYMAIWLLTFHLYHFARHSRQAEIDQNKYEKLAIAAQFNQLNAELNPHFLFNSLNSIKALTLENPQAAREAVDLLSNMLRNALQFTDKRVIPLKEEMKRINAYLALEKIRFEERLQYTFDIQPETLTIEIPPLSLYNLVENAVKHGINKSVMGGHIQISAYVEENQIHLVVTNDGTLDETPGKGVGLKNVAERIKLVYGTVAKLNLTSVSQDKVESKLSLPIGYAT